MNLVGLAINPVPSGAEIGLLSSYDGMGLRFARWAPTRGPDRGTVCVFPGRGEFIEKYFEVIADLRRRGFAVAILDWRGQGGSGRPLSNRRKGHVAQFAEYDRDLECFMSDVVLPALPRPYYALAHSMGGNIMLRASHRAENWFDRLILVSPMIAIHDAQTGHSQRVSRMYAESAAAIGFAAAFVPGGSTVAKECGPFENNQLTSDMVRWSRNKAVLEAAPELGIGSPTVGWVRSALRSCAVLQRPDFPAYVTRPMLLFAAGADRIVGARSIEDFALKLKLGTHIAIPGARHEILQENDQVRQLFWSAFDAYLGCAMTNAAGAGVTAR